MTPLRRAITTSFRTNKPFPASVVHFTQLHAGVRGNQVQDSDKCLPIQIMILVLSLPMHWL